MKIVFLGSTQFSKKLLMHLISENFEIAAVFSMPKYFSISYSAKKIQNTNFANLAVIADENNIPVYEIDSRKGKKLIDHKLIIKDLKPDVIFALGWYYMIPKLIREIPKYGAWGIHASLLPKYAGGAPLVWAIINGEKETGVTLFKLSSGVDDGDIILQEKIVIGENDSIAQVYEKATIASKKIMIMALKKTKTITFVKQDKEKIEIYPQRKPEDGLINWSWDKKRIKDFIRAQSKPYPGAFTIIKGKKIIIHDAIIEDLEPDVVDKYS